MFTTAINNTACIVLSLFIFTGSASASENIQSENKMSSENGPSKPSLQEIDALITSVEKLIAEQDQKLIDLYEKIEIETDENRRQSLVELQEKKTAMLDQLEQQLRKVRKLRAQYSEAESAPNPDGDSQ